MDRLHIRKHAYKPISFLHYLLLDSKSTGSAHITSSSLALIFGIMFVTYSLRE